MKRIALLMAGAFLLGGLGTAIAQTGTAPAPANPAAPAAAAPEASAPAAAESGEHAKEIQAFHRMIKMHHRMWKRLKQNPEVVTNDDWVAKYPDLRNFFNSYHGSKKRFLAEPGTYLKMNEAKAKRREEHRGAGGE
jgi:hypothetical protein